ncbi:MAG: hypothetical protein JOY58_16255 [Solirubrobacterales bacterium]|nr:hypothetical protein [Solirubrobacterales bacterium]
MDLDAYRHSAEAFLSELTAEFYRHYAGLKDDYEIEPIYARHPSLFTRKAVDELRQLAAEASPGGEDRRRLVMLSDFAIEGFIGQATKQLESELARREAALELVVDGGRIGFRESAVMQANEPNGERRAEIEDARLELIDRVLNPLYRELVGNQHAVARELGYRSYEELCAECKQVDLRGLQAQTAAFSAATEAAFADVLEPQLRRGLGIGLGELRRSDLPRFFRAAEEDDRYPAPQVVPSFIETARGLGFALERQPQVVLDVESRPNKSPRAFCAPVRVPSEVYLVISPVGGRDDFAALFHEGGHTQHYANVDHRLPFEFRCLGDNAITESFAFLLQHLIEQPEWLSRRLGCDDAHELSAHARAVRLIYLRRYAGKLAYELELHGDGHADYDSLADRYSALLSEALQIPWRRETFLADVDPGFYSSCYLRAWALETHLRAHLQERFGPRWFESNEAGAALQGLWREGQRLTPQELLAALTGQQLDFTVLLSDLGLAP